MEKEVYIRILQLKNNFYRDNGRPEGKPLGNYCVLGYFDAFDMLEERNVSTTKFNTWEHLGELTSQMDGTANCRMLVCVTDRQDKDHDFWEKHDAPLYFITMIRVDKAKIPADKLDEFMKDLNREPNQISYLSFDHSEIIVVRKTVQYSTGFRSVNELRKRSDVVKTYTIFATLEESLQTYESIKEKVADEKVCCRLHCMVKSETKAEIFKKELEKLLNSRSSGKKIEVRKFETLGVYDWLMEVDDVSIWSVLECYKMGNLLTHANERYNEAFYNIESEILVR